MLMTSNGIDIVPNWKLIVPSPQTKADSDLTGSHCPAICDVSTIGASLSEHAEWLESLGHRGRRAVLAGANLRDLDLHAAQLQLADLREADLSNANLQSASLQGANLQGADLSFCNLEGANLQEADLRLVRGLTPEQLSQSWNAILSFLSAEHIAELDLPLDHECRLLRRDLSQYTIPRLRLRDAFLVDFNFSSANLSEADLQGSSLRSSNFTAAFLCGTALKNADLACANLYRADLQHACLEGANLYKANLIDSILQNADLSEARGLTPGQLAGADVACAKLPESVADFPSFAIVEETSKNAKALFLSVCVGCLYSLLTIASTRDVALMTSASSTPLPIIQTNISIVGFYIVAPLLLFGVYVYLHFYLQNLWEELSLLPGVLSDGRPLYAKTDPWLLNDLVKANSYRIVDSRGFFSRLQVAVSIFLAWWLVPATLCTFWFRYLTRADWRGTSIQITLIAVSFYAATSLYNLCIRTLRHELEKPNQKRRFRPFRFLSTCAVGLGLIGVSWLIVSGVESGDHLFAPIKPSHDPRTWVIYALSQLGYRPFPSFAYTDVSLRPSNWTGQDVKQVRGADLRGAHLRYLDARRAFLPNSDLQNANLESANLAGANLEGANLYRANLKRVELGVGDTWEAFRMGAGTITATEVGANLRNANLSTADLTEADLLGAQLQGANLTYASLKGAILQMANLEGADLRDASLDGIESRAIVIGPDQLKSARRQLRDACVDRSTQLPLQIAHAIKLHFCSATIKRILADHAKWLSSNGKEGVLGDFSNTELGNANFADVDLSGANFKGAKLCEVNFDGANLSGANLKDAIVLQNQLFSAKNVDETVRYSDISACFGEP